MSMENMPLLEFADRCPVKEYRISDDKIEARIVAGGRDQDRDWRAVSSEQLSSHVKNNTAVARWLERNLGWRRLLRACVGLEPVKFRQDCWGREITFTHREFNETP
jgi:hypothetical protein